MRAALPVPWSDVILVPVRTYLLLGDLAVVILLLFLGGIAAPVGWVWLLISAFAESVPWGVGTLLFPPIGLVFSFLTWPEYKAPTVLYVGGVVLYFLGQMIG